MSMKKAQGQGASAGEMLALAMKNVERVLRELDAIAEALEAGEARAIAEAKATVSDVRKAIQTVFEERQRLGKHDENSANDGAGSGLDLERAREEIWRRLARLRDAGASEELS